MLSQYYADDRAIGSKRGAKIVADHQLPRAVTSTQIKSTKEFVALVDTVRKEGFSPEMRRHVSEFNLRHPDSFRTLTTDEHRP